MSSAWRLPAPAARRGQVLLLLFSLRGTRRAICRQYPDVARRDRSRPAPAWPVTHSELCRRRAGGHPAVSSGRCTVEGNRLGRLRAVSRLGWRSPLWTLARMRGSAIDVPQECPVRLSDTETTALRRGGSEYAELSRLVRDAGLLDRRGRYYAWKIVVTVGALAGGWAAVVVAGDSWWTLAVAVWLAVLFTQVGFLGHDAGHRQIFGSRRSSYVAGVLLGNLGIGLSYGWWVAKHNRHHAHPNTEGADPDIAA